MFTIFSYLLLLGAALAIIVRVYLTFVKIRLI